MSRRMFVVFLVGAIAFLVGGVFLLRDHPWIAGSAIVFFGFGVIVLLIALVRPSQLEIDAEGFRLRLLLRRTWRRRSWLDCSRFTSEVFTRTTTLVTYSASTTTAGKTARRNEAVQAGYGGLSAADLADLLNRYRSAKLATQAAADR